MYLYTEIHVPVLTEGLGAGECLGCLTSARRARVPNEAVILLLGVVQGVPRSGELSVTRAVQGLG